MGFSCSSYASLAQLCIQNFCVKSTDMENVYKDKGSRFVIEYVRKTRPDGSITATVYKEINNLLYRSSSMRIEPTGVVSKGPKILRDLPKYVLQIDNSEMAYYQEPTEDSLRKAIDKYVDSYKQGGVNYHITELKGHIPYPQHANIIDLRNGNIVQSWSASAFQVWN